MTKENTKVTAVQCGSYNIDELRNTIRKSVELLGGWPDTVQKGSSVLLKPNLLTARPPEHAVTTHPEFVRAVICELREKGVKRIALADSPAGSYPWDVLWGKTGMKQLAEEENIELIPLEEIKRVKINEDISVPVMKEMDEFDTLISLPKLKTHILTKVTAAVKNSYGLIPGKAKSMFHGQYQSPLRMGEFIADIFNVIKPDFVIMDAVDCMQGQGPANGSPFRLGVVFAGEDAVAIDSCACEVYNYKASNIPLLMKAAGNGFGIADSAKIERLGDAWEIVKNKTPKRSTSDFLHAIPQGMFHILTLFLSFRPHINQKTCVKCGVCEKVCSQKAIIKKDGKFIVQGKKCILCMCCIESCASHAIKLKTIWGRMLGK